MNRGKIVSMYAGLNSHPTGGMSTIQEGLLSQVIHANKSLFQAHYVMYILHTVVNHTVSMCIGDSTDLEYAPVKYIIQILSVF